MKTKDNRNFPVIIFFLNLVLYTLFNYGGLRIPDSEIVFRTTESLALRNDFSVPEPIDYFFWGLGPGIDQKHYSIFGPAESILAVPMLKIAYLLERNNLKIDSTHIPISFYVSSNNKAAGNYYIAGKLPPDMKGQYARFVVSFFNSIISAIAGVFYYFVLLSITKSKIISFYTTFLYSFGCIIFPYTGTFFSEPLCTLFVILSLLFILKNETENEKNPKINHNYFYSGLFVGLAITTHITAVLSVPFYYMFILGQRYKEKFDLRRFGASGLYFTLGLIIFSVLLLYYNSVRFGNIFETGRSADPLYHYAIYSNPLIGLYGLLLSPGKGLFIYSPIVFLSIIFWKYFHNSYKHLSIGVLGMIIIRLFFIASRSDWHGGYGAGPRYLVLIMPFLFIPIALGLKNMLIRHKFKRFLWVAFFSFLCIAQQIYLSVGEIFSYFHIIFKQQKRLGINTLSNYSQYLNWKYCPALPLLNYRTGPFFLKYVSSNNYFLWFLMVLIFLIIFSIFIFIVYKSYNRNQSASYAPIRTLKITKVNSSR